MKKFGIALATIAALALGTVSTADAQGKGRRDGAHKQRHASAQHRAAPRNFRHAVDRRQVRQRARIQEGRRAGQLNRHEVSRLRADQRRIGKLERRFGSDGHYNRHERRALKGALDHSSKRIWRMKHNRHGGYRGHGWHRGHKHGHGWKRGHGKHRRFHRHFRHGPRWPHRYRGHVQHVYPVYDDSPVHSHGLEVETPDFRFKVYGSS